MKIAVFTSDKQIAKYPDLTETFITLLRKYWPDCPYPVEVVSNTIEPQCDVPVFLTGEDTAWSNQAIYYLVNQTEPVLIALEDYLICKSPRAGDIARCLEIVESNQDVAFVRLVPWPGPEFGDSGLVGEFYKPTARYLFSLMMTIWNPLHLVQMMPPNMNPWQVELVGTEMIREYPARMLGAREVLIEYKNGLKGGRWQPEVEEWLKSVLQQ